MDVVLGPDVFVNASVALGSPPELVVRRLLGGGQKAKTSKWVVARIEAMLLNLPSFRKEAVASQMASIRGLTEIIEQGDYGADRWVEALSSLARAAGVRRVLTDHPDLGSRDGSDGLEFLSTEAWLFERQMPPPPPSMKPGTAKKSG